MAISPVVLFVFNRPEHTRRTLETLSKNELAQKTALYIFSDGPKENASPEMLTNIEATRKCIHSKKWCGKVFIQEHSHNIGLAASIISGLNEVFSVYESAIVLEDDIVTSPRFLQFMNEGLEFYKEKEMVAGISGFAYNSLPVVTKVHFLPIGCSWGWATWKRQWEITEFDAGKLLNSIRVENLVKQFDFGGYPFYNMLIDQYEGRVNSWAIRFYASFFLQQKYFVYPPASFTQNVGFDDTATHTKVKEVFFDNVSIKNSNYTFLEPGLNDDTEKVRAAFEHNYVRAGLKQKSTLFSLIVRLLRKVKKIIR